MMIFKPNSLFLKEFYLECFHPPSEEMINCFYIRGGTKGKETNAHTHSQLLTASLNVDVNHRRLEMMQCVHKASSLCLYTLVGLSWGSLIIFIVFSH